MEYLIIYIIGGAVACGIFSYLADHKEEYKENSVKIGCVGAIIWPAVPFMLIGSLIGKLIYKLSNNDQAE